MHIGRRAICIYQLRMATALVDLVDKPSPDFFEVSDPAFLESILSPLDARGGNRRVQIQDDSNVRHQATGCDAPDRP